MLVTDNHVASAGEVTYLSTNRNIGNLSLHSVNELGTLSIEQLRPKSVSRPSRKWGRLKTYMELIRILAQGSVVLLDKVPANLILAQVVVVTRRCGSVVRSGGAWRCLFDSVLELVRVCVITVGCHGCFFGYV